jgi:hypothetical protein
MYLANRKETVQSLFVAKSRTVLLGPCVLEAVESEVSLKTLLGQGLDFRRLEPELGHSQVVPQSAFLGGGGDGNDSLVDGPAQGHGFLADAVLGGQRLQEIIDGTGSGSSVDGGQRTESLNGDAVLLRPGQEVLALEVGVEFDLVNHGLQSGRRPDGLEVLRQEVGHTNGLGLARLLDLLHLGPSSLELGSVTGVIEWVVHGVLGLALGKPGRVNQIQIDVVGLELLQGLGDRTLDVVNVDDDLGGDEEFLPREAGFPDGNPDLRLGVVDFGTIDVTETDADSLLNGINGSVADLVDVRALEKGGTGPVSNLGIVRCQSANGSLWGIRSIP